MSLQLLGASRKFFRLISFAAFCNFLQLSATICNYLQLSATICNYLQLYTTKKWFPPHELKNQKSEQKALLCTYGILIRWYRCSFPKKVPTCARKKKNEKKNFLNKNKGGRCFHKLAGRDANKDANPFVCIPKNKKG